VTEAEDVVEALLSDAPLPALEALHLSDPVLREVREAARARLAAGPPSSPALDLLHAVSRFPGRTRAELALHAGLSDEAAAAAGAELLARGLVTSARFGRNDVWSRTTAGAAVLRDAPAGRLQE
jgi:hypothetical protein